MSSGKRCPGVSLTASNPVVLAEDVAPPSGDKVAEGNQQKGEMMSYDSIACKYM